MIRRDNLSKKGHFDKMDKPIRNQSQIGFRLMNLILYSHLFTNTHFKSDEEIFAYEGLTYLDYIKGNWEKLKKQIDNYEKLLVIEKEIEIIIENKIIKKTEKIKEKELTKYAAFADFYTKQKEVFREKNSKEM